MKTINRYGAYRNNPRDKSDARAQFTAKFESMNNEQQRDDAFDIVKKWAQEHLRTTGKALSIYMDTIKPDGSILTHDIIMNLADELCPVCQREIIFPSQRMCDPCAKQIADTLTQNAPQGRDEVTGVPNGDKYIWCEKHGQYYWERSGCSDCDLAENAELAEEFGASDESDERDPDEDESFDDAPETFDDLCDACGVNEREKPSRLCTTCALEILADLDTLTDEKDNRSAIYEAVFVPADEQGVKISAIDYRDVDALDQADTKDDDQAPAKRGTAVRVVFNHLGIPGCKRSHKSRVTGTIIHQIYLPQASALKAELGIDSDAPWMIRCADHGHFALFTSGRDARDNMALAEFCKDCQKKITEQA